MTKVPKNRNSRAKRATRVVDPPILIGLDLPRQEAARCPVRDELPQGSGSGRLLGIDLAELREWYIRPPVDAARIALVRVGHPLAVLYRS